MKTLITTLDGISRMDTNFIVMWLIAQEKLNLKEFSIDKCKSLERLYTTGAIKCVRHDHLGSMMFH
jgi:hypothetical protein